MIYAQLLELPDDFFDSELSHDNSGKSDKNFIVHSLNQLFICANDTKNLQARLGALEKMLFQKYNVHLIQLPNQTL